MQANRQDQQFAREFKNINLVFRNLSDNLQKSLLEIRKVPASNLIQKIPRMVRDLAQSLGKKAEVKISGHEVQIDKSLDLMASIKSRRLSTSRNNREPASDVSCPPVKSA